MTIVLYFMILKKSFDGNIFNYGDSLNKLEAKNNYEFKYFLRNGIESCKKATFGLYKLASKLRSLVINKFKPTNIKQKS